jgi:hypothetical protein
LLLRFYVLVGFNLNPHPCKTRKDGAPTATKNQRENGGSVFTFRNTLVRAAVMLFVVDLAGELVLLMIQGRAIAGGQVAVVVGAHSVFLVV